MIISNTNSTYYLLTTTTAFTSFIIFVVIIIIVLIKCTFCERRHKAATTTSIYSERNNGESPYYNIDNTVAENGGQSKIDGNNNVNVNSTNHRTTTTTNHSNNDDFSHYLQIEDEDDLSEENMGNGGGDCLYESPLDIDEKISKNKNDKQNKLDKKSSSIMREKSATHGDNVVDGRGGEMVYFEDDNDKSLYSSVVKRDKNNNNEDKSKNENVSSSKLSKISENFETTSNEQPYIPRKKFNVQEETIRCSMNLDQKQQQQPRSPSSKPPSTTTTTPSFKHQLSEGSGHYDVLPDYEVISDIRKDSRTRSSINDNSPNHSVQEATIVLNNDGDDNYYSNIENYTSAPSNRNMVDNDEKHTVHIRSSNIIVDTNSRYSSNSGQYSDINHVTETVNATSTLETQITNSPRHDESQQTINKSSPLNDIQQSPSLYDSIRF